MKCVVSRIVSHILEMINPIKSMFQKLSPPLILKFEKSVFDTSERHGCGSTLPKRVAGGTLKLIYV